MDRAKTKRIETAVDMLAAAVFAGAVGHAVFQLFNPLGAIGAAAAAYALGLLALSRVAAADDGFAVPAFVAPAYCAPELEELLLTESDRLPAAAGQDEPLLLDDILTEIAPDSRVVRLFDPTRMPTPGQLNARIERHLGEGNGAAAPSDASQALYDALSELRQTLR
jgi:hypothetical protein